MSYKTMEELWCASEELFKNQEDTAQTILAEIFAKLSIYKSLDQSSNLNIEEKHKLKVAVYGKIISSLTQLSLVDNINSFAALHQAVLDMKKEKSLL